MDCGRALGRIVNPRKLGLGTRLDGFPAATSAGGQGGTDGNGADASLGPGRGRLGASIELFCAA